ncbi:phosphatidylinositol N-acetylglucosaminyltransferase subunit H-like [Danaus plexippus]|uniref:Phosphatidylinositol N-acetylglucosaminyltransferase subunit H n=1 Tax=Danaus plexippus plexippus TaxID=278856 RepID=A0A212F711_DANPL|nr:phosphatidylinositol N-acetylglucosaminyltransferase subunit H-like [Danaus plexippus]OWR49532.1 Phosphatidylinositol N-acetylglucosaminyltransferase subunit H [Danaus plexippus plexippus]
MPNHSKTIEHENVNGIKLSLKIKRRSSTPNSQKFIVSFKSNREKSAWHSKSLYLSVIFNLLALWYVRISLHAILVIVIVLSFLIFFWITHSVQSETLLVIPTVGIQSSVKYVYGQEDYFVPWSSIDDVIINEVIQLNRVLYFLTLIVKSGSSSNDMDSTKLIPLFKYTKPRLMMLETIYSELQVLLMASQNKEPDLGSGDKQDVG